ncbi:hypothetical protein HPB51_023628 [Rhipicephalus microplus]|uniref:Uncharacterized protein n=1 Tax=Rhipicephalus microplus TaxID=6941 RepID=A0A9J6DDA9_RHIMP|nr:hypothetical protein HPB51_023628 [Rhipicephalus microplus]
MSELSTQTVQEPAEGGAMESHDAEKPDMSHVSQIVPTIEPTFAVCSAPNRCREFAAAVGYKEAQIPTLLMAKAMGLTDLELIYDSELLKQVRKNFFEGLG